MTRLMANASGKKCIVKANEIIIIVSDINAVKDPKAL